MVVMPPPQIEDMNYVIGTAQVDIATGSFSWTPLSCFLTLDISVTPEPNDTAAIQT